MLYTEIYYSIGVSAFSVTAACGLGQPSGTSKRSQRFRDVYCFPSSHEKVGRHLLSRVRQKQLITITEI
jgi:hypothetical protein